MHTQTEYRGDGAGGEEGASGGKGVALKRLKITDHERRTSMMMMKLCLKMLLLLLLLTTTTATNWMKTQCFD